ncbi:hypothetical protein AAFF_G00193240 [Aldrovandia affinis]|uniref:Uncharacterized protein n=1 Tax=Aldrovandia affinis TaxID=143900 RepID=A0AAD7VXB2_9TELE|nr:hypothetical protein AAFF_G00193240 [Aldrovandia affinis]
MDANDTLSLELKDQCNFSILAQQIQSLWNRSQLHADNTKLVDNLDVKHGYLLQSICHGCLHHALCGRLPEELSHAVHLKFRKKSLQNLQSTVYYHPASLTASDFILMLCMPIELYNSIGQLVSL